MEKWKSKLSWSIVLLMVGVYLFGFSSGASYFLIESLTAFFKQTVPVKSIFGWAAVGLSLSLLASLFAWPFALSITTLLEHNKTWPQTRYLLGLTSYVSTLPLVLFVYFYIEVVGIRGFEWVKSFWVFVFASQNLLTQAIAFALTLILYPLTALPGYREQVSVDLFYKEMLHGVIEFAEVGLVASIVVLGLFLYVLPKMVLKMRSQINNDQNLRGFEIVKSMGGTDWESIHLSVMQSMKNRFNSIVLYFTRLCFFEGLITYSLLSYFFLSNEEKNYLWTSSLSSKLVSWILQPQSGDFPLIWLTGLLILIYIFFRAGEYHLKSRKGGQGV